MTYKVLMLPAARKALRGMHPDVRNAVIGLMDCLCDDPRPPGVCALKEHRPYLRVRCGDYRVIYSVDDDAKVVAIALALHRGEVYKVARRTLG